MLQTKNPQVNVRNLEISGTPLGNHKIIHKVKTVCLVGCKVVLPVF